jgi:hypothetical protein
MNASSPLHDRHDVSNRAALLTGATIAAVMIRLVAEGVKLSLEGFRLWAEREQQVRERRSIMTRSSTKLEVS